MIVVIAETSAKRDITDRDALCAGNGDLCAAGNLIDDAAVVLRGDIQQVVRFVKQDIDDDAGVENQRLKMAVPVDKDMLGGCHIQRTALGGQRADIDDGVFLTAIGKALVGFKSLRVIAGQAGVLGDPDITVLRLTKRFGPGDLKVHGDLCFIAHIGGRVGFLPETRKRGEKKTNQYQVKKPFLHRIIQPYCCIVDTADCRKLYARAFFPTARLKELNYFIIYKTI